MSTNSNRNEAVIKFRVPDDLKQSLQQLAKERNIAISSLLRLTASEYVKRNRTT
jgi:predicted transcriptional regulator